MSSSFGSNLGFVDELYADYLNDPQSVSESWQEFFADYQPTQGVDARPVTPSPAATPVTAPPAPEEAPEAPEAVAPEPEEETTDDTEMMVGITARIAENMEESLTVPTATSTRVIPMRLLEENRRLLNQHQAALGRPKISFTHLIGWAVVRALKAHPRMNAAYDVIDDKPHRRQRAAINLGLAIDMERKGQRILLVPNIKDCGQHNFPSFMAAYNELVAKARSNKLTLDDYADTSVTLTNPGTLGTLMSVPRLMNTQGLIIGTGAIGYPAEYTGMAPEVISALGLSKVMTITSTYDHRIIQGAESGMFLASVDKLLAGEQDFYDSIFSELEVPHEAMEWDKDRSPAIAGQSDNVEAIRKQAAVLQLIRAYRVRGHLWADLNPLGYKPQATDELEMSAYGLTVWDLDRKFIAGGLAGHHGRMPLREILDTLRETYTRNIGVEYMHIPEPEPRAWLQKHMESTHNAAPIESDYKKRILEKLNAAEALESFLHKAFVGQKRFSLEGAETTVPMLVALLDEAARAGVEEAFIGMAHRGRLNVLANVMGKPYETIFREFQGDMDPATPHGSGDVKYHLGAEGTHTNPEGDSIQITLASNPSHLEAVDPVVEGMVRARQDQLEDKERTRVLPILVHGDAAFSGQGVVAETFALSQLSGYSTGGTVHIVINNQIGFTANPMELRSSLYATDVAKAVRAPILHVNAEYPEAAVRAIRLALAFRQSFKIDVVVDLLCYRRWGHNEGDEPSYTNPLMYQQIKKQRSVRKLYTERLLRRGDLDMESAEKALDDFQQQLRAVHDAVEKPQDPPRIDKDRELTDGVADGTGTDTAVSHEALVEVMDALDALPEGFEPHPKLARQLAKRRDKLDGDAVDWALAEAFAFGTLSLEGTPVRLSGEDSGRGTFSQRHSVLHDHRTGETHVPLANIRDDQAPFRVHDSLLSEFAVLGFEYGYSVQHPDSLTLWEAQFGDFVNGAQVIIDQFISSAEDKWGQFSGIVMLLPHGFEGQGPEHSSARIERFLQACAEGNWRVCNPTTPAQYFHLLRRQVRTDTKRCPLVIFTPKSLLRLPAAVSPAEDFTSGHFREVLPGSHVPDPATTERLLFCSGKVYYDIERARQKQGLDNVAVVRLEQFYPMPVQALEELLSRYEKVEDLVWVQEEPRNMGGWNFVRIHTSELLGGRPLRFVGRPPSASPATGSHRRHSAEQEDLVNRALTGDPNAAEPGRG